ncbi:MAG: head decoration protein, partial [Alphaproteobacteria bacterium HGW-Alphaproteobacteria-5]
MTALTQTPSMGDVLKYEADPNYCRETVTLLSGTNYGVGSVLGLISTAGATAAAGGSNTGNGVLTVDATDPVLADAMKRIGVVERSGRGVDKIYRGMLRFGRPEPDYSRTGDSSVVLQLATVAADEA